MFRTCACLDHTWLCEIKKARLKSLHEVCWQKHTEGSSKAQWTNPDSHYSSELLDINKLMLAVKRTKGKLTAHTLIYLQLCSSCGFDPKASNNQTLKDKWEIWCRSSESETSRNNKPQRFQLNLCLCDNCYSVDSSRPVHSHSQSFHCSRAQGWPCCPPPSSTSPSVLVKAPGLLM